MADIRFLRSGLALVSALSLSFGLMTTGCTGDDDDDDASSQPTPSPTPPDEFGGEITITNPSREGANVPLTDNLTAFVAFEVEDFDLREAGDCGAKVNTCGRVKILLDGAENGTAIESPALVDFSKASEATGEHTIKLELVFDNGSSTGVSDEVSVNATSPDVTAPPVLAITGPNPNDLHNLGDDANSSFEFEVLIGAFVLLDNESDTECTPPEDEEGNPIEDFNCGYLGVKIDGESAHSSFAYGEDLDEETGVVTVVADFGDIGDPTGLHEITVEALHEDGTPYEVTNQQGNSQVIRAQEEFNMVEADEPTLHIESPAAGAQVTLGNDDNLTVPILFSNPNFTLKAPGTCGSQQKCGHVHVNIDAEDEDTTNDCKASPSDPYNNAGASSPIDAYFGYCPTSTGLHTITLSLHDDSHNPVLSSGLPVESSIRVTTLPNDNPTITITRPQDGAATVELQDSPPNGKIFNFLYTVTNFNLAAEGSCSTDFPGEKNCGHVRVNVDGDDCNAPGKSYNVLDFDTPSVEVAFNFCTSAVGTHEITFGLYTDAGQPFEVNGHHVKHDIDITTVDEED